MANFPHKLCIPHDNRQNMSLIGCIQSFPGFNHQCHILNCVAVIFSIEFNKSVKHITILYASSYAILYVFSYRIDNKVFHPSFTILRMVEHCCTQHEQEEKLKMEMDFNCFQLN